MRNILHNSYSSLALVAASLFCSATTAYVQKHSGTACIRINGFSTPTALGFFNFGKPQPEEPPTAKEEPVKATEEPDLVEKIFTAFFGKPEASPFGLQRFDETRFPEQYPATTTDFDVEPVETDDKDMATLRPLLKNTNLEKRGLRITYDANRDGWDAYKFHQIVDRQGPAIVLCQTRLGVVCGGYNPKGWVGYGEARGSIAAFLFRRKNSLGGSPQWTKLKKVGGASYAQGMYNRTQCRELRPPLFLHCPLILSLQSTTPKQVHPLEQTRW
jgi:hypothetical protein